MNLLINDWDANKNILFCNENDGTPFMKIRNNLGKPVSILVGPEGGFSKKELYFQNVFQHYLCILQDINSQIYLLILFQIQNQYVVMRNKPNQSERNITFNNFII